MRIAMKNNNDALRKTLEKKATEYFCASGCGDGSYPLEVKEIDGKIVAMKISFM